MGAEDAYGQRHGRTSRERAEERAMQAAREEFAGSVAGQDSARQEAQLLALGQECAALKRDLATLQQFVASLRGENGIEIKGPIITLRKRTLDDGAGTGTTLNLYDEGVLIVTGAASIDVVGSALTLSTVGPDATLTYAFTVQDHDSDFATDVNVINFTGSVVVTAGATPNIVNVAVGDSAYGTITSVHTTWDGSDITAKIIEAPGTDLGLYDE